MPQPSPELFFETVNAYQRTAALKAAIELELFTAIDEGAHTVADISRRCDASERGIRILCDYLTIVGFLTKSDDTYDLTLDTRVFLSRGSPAYLGGTLSFLASAPITGGFEHLAETVRRGTLPSGDGTVELEHPVWVEFARAMAPLTTMPADMIADVIEVERLEGGRVLDIAAGHGLFGIALARRHPTLEVVAQDWESVLRVASENARAAGVAARYRTLPGSAFDVELGSGYALALLTNFLHHFDIAQNVEFLKRVHSALAPGGRTVILEFVPNEDRVTPPLSASFSLSMLSSTPSGDAYTYKDLDGMLAAAGFARSELHRLDPSVQQIVVGYA